MGTTSISNSPAIAGSRRAPGPHWVAPHVLRHLLEAMNISANDKENIMALKLVDIDDPPDSRQVATTWIPDFGIESAIIVSDKVANDPVQKSVAGLAAPDIKVSVFGATSSSRSSRRPSSRSHDGALHQPIDALKLHENGLPFDYLNVSGMRFNDQRHRLHKNMSVTAEEKAAFEELIGLGVECWMQTTTRDSKEPVSELLKNY